MDISFILPVSILLRTHARAKRSALRTRRHRILYPDWAPLEAPRPPARAMSPNAIRSSRNAPTAASFAPFRTTGALPPARSACRASLRQGKRASSGASKVIWVRAKSKRLRAVGQPRGVAQRVADRARACRARPSARAPRRHENSTMECMTLCGVHHHFDHASSGIENRWCASMTSRPLFIIVAQSTVILRPMRQVGWPSASSTRRALDGLLLPGAERPARRGQDQLPGPVSVRALQALEDGAVLAVHRQDHLAQASGPSPSPGRPR